LTQDRVRLVPQRLRLRATLADPRFATPPGHEVGHREAAAGLWSVGWAERLLAFGRVGQRATGTVQQPDALASPSVA